MNRRLPFYRHERMVSLSIPAAGSSSPFSSFSLDLLRRDRRDRVSKALCSSPTTSSRDSNPEPSPQRPQRVLRGNHAGLRLEESVEIGAEKTRLDSWISSRIQGVSRARIQSSIRSGFVVVNGRTVDKVSHIIKGGDMVSCTVSELQPLRAKAEDIPLDIVYEDAYVLVVNKPAHMQWISLAPCLSEENYTKLEACFSDCQGCSPSTWKCKWHTESSDNEMDNYYFDQSSVEGVSSENSEALVRPGIVHRLDKGTSGLLVVAKDEHSHAHLAEQFKLHTIHRVYISLTCGVPNPSSGRIEIPIARDSNNRIRMAAVSGTSNSRHARYAASRYKVIKVLGGGGSSLVEWRLETGRTHQIRAHAKYLGIPLLGDEVYGGTKSMALSLLRPRTSSSHHGHLSQILSKVQRPCLHASLLGFKHPHTGEHLRFSCPPPDDFAEVLDQLQSISPC
ncbi:RNA pseudouridine synthase 2, chloroplastic [Phoenix dactylifera]|uniref:RNA pseudouridine synthase 2, chloroplastic n=1 Tax=Phoenix dactylifera TaxID=42345 RepID=A0A8B7CTN7_PHODC|nr:RNA pseudouridine synthase 2, chloroplastic [Phoenix dactylifera]